MLRGCESILFKQPPCRHLTNTELLKALHGCGRVFQRPTAGAIHILGSESHSYGNTLMEDRIWNTYVVGYFKLATFSIQMQEI